MALEIRSIPILTGTAAEHFIEAAEANERNPHKERIRFTLDDIKHIANSGKERLKRASSEIWSDGIASTYQASPSQSPL